MSTTKPNKIELTPKQRKAAVMLADPSFEGTISQLCETVGVARSTFYDWMKLDNFRAYTEEVIDRYTDSELARVWKALLRQIESGDTQAIKLYFELKGRYKQSIQLDGAMLVQIVDDLDSADAPEPPQKIGFDSHGD